MNAADPLVLKVKRLRPEAWLPTKAHGGDAGWDLRCVAPVTVEPGKIVRVPTGLAVAVPPGWCGVIAGRSGLAVRGVVVLGGVIDHGYAGEVAVLLGVLAGIGMPGVSFEPGDRVAQMLIVPVPEAIVVEVDELGDSERGERGFGSSGV
jgi:dUTP pyrophosphatase